MRWKVVCGFHDMVFPLESLCEFNIFNYRRERRKKKNNKWVHFSLWFSRGKSLFSAPQSPLHPGRRHMYIMLLRSGRGVTVGLYFARDGVSVLRPIPGPLAHPWSPGPSLVPRITWAVPPPYSTCLSLSHLPYLWFNIHMWAYLIAFLLSHNNLSSTTTWTVFVWVQHWIYTGPREISGQKINDQLMFMKWINDGNKKEKKVKWPKTNFQRAKGTCAPLSTSQSRCWAPKDDCFNQMHSSRFQVDLVS